MNVWVLIPIMALSIPLLAIWTHHKRSLSKGFGSSGAEVDRLNAVITEMHQDMTKLKDRVSVLERLATSEDRRIAEEIDRLSRSPGAGR
jgi:glycyl-tRNA synthetase beta subunit